MHATLGMDDNTRAVLIAVIAGVPAWIAAVASVLVRRATKTPSGEKIGTVAERTHDMASTNSAMLTQVSKNTANGTTQEA